jgi:hypothetical protein
MKRPPKKNCTSSKFKGNFRVVTVEDVHKKSRNYGFIYKIIIIIIIIITAA